MKRSKRYLRVIDIQLWSRFTFSRNTNGLTLRNILEIRLSKGTNIDQKFTHPLEIHLSKLDEDHVIVRHDVILTAIGIMKSGRSKNIEHFGI